MNTMISETYKGVDKIKRYGWSVKDEPGTFMMLSKDLLFVHEDYQREATLSKVKEITASWSWVGCGAIVVGYRNGSYWVIDGQHRVLSAQRRSDINELPCIVFKTKDIKQEAKAFLDLNAGRKPVTAFAKFKAMKSAGIESAKTVDGIINELGLTITAHADKPNEFKSVAWALKKVDESEEDFYTVMRVAKQISTDMPLHQTLLKGLWYINRHIEGGIDEPRLRQRLIQVGARPLIHAATSASAYFAKGWDKVYAIGMLEVINKGLRNKFSLSDD